MAGGLSSGDRGNWIGPPRRGPTAYFLPRVAERVPGTGLAVTIDLGDSLDLHPKRKRGVGERLASIALTRTDGVDIEDSGQVFA